MQQDSACVLLNDERVCLNLPVFNHLAAASSYYFCDHVVGTSSMLNLAGNIKVRTVLPHTAFKGHQQDKTFVVGEWKQTS